MLTGLFHQQKGAPMNILVVGGGGREHALVTSLAASPLSDTIFVAPGNGGTAEKAVNVTIDTENGDMVVDFALKNDVGLVVIGPEAPLVAGVADAVRTAGVACFGPGAEGARLEGSKRVSKELMERYCIPTAAYGSFDNKDEALAYLEQVGAPIVVKADGLAAGKGVIVAHDREQARVAIEDCFSGRFGEAGATVVIEQMLTGPECSLLVFTDGVTTLPMAPAQDHKRALEGDRGPNTGGMGVYSPVPIVTAEEHTQMVALMRKTVDALRSEGIDYRGVLYGGFMLTPEGPKVLEFNVRFGDPETQVILPRLTTDLVEVMCAVANKTLATITLDWKDDWAVSVVLASGGYPGEYAKELPIFGVERAEELEGVTIYHAGTALDQESRLVTDGGRVLNVTALGDDFQTARDQAYRAVSMIDFEGKQFRGDIGARALRGREAWDE